MDIKFANNASSKLVDNITEETISFSILPDTGILFPVLEQATDFFKVTVVDPGTGDFEIMKVTSTRGDTFTVERAQEGTLARAFPQNAIVDNRLTAGSIEVILNDVDASSTTAGRIRVATEEEVKDGVANDAALTPANSDFLKVLRGTVVPFTGQLDDEGFAIDSKTRKSRDDWHICDGTYGTPDLRDRFIVAAGVNYPAGSVGGETAYEFKAESGEHALTVEEMPSHNHHLWRSTSGSGDGTFGDASSPSVMEYTSSTGGNKPHKHPFTFTAPEKIVPPYYSLVYIMKIK